VAQAVEDTNMSPNTFSATFEDTGWTWEQVLGDEFYLRWEFICNNRTMQNFS
jgi:hypothetical protein